MRTALLCATLLAAASSAAWAQNTFELPRECRERHGVDPEKCVIQDGPPADPWVRKKVQTAKPPASPPPAPAPAPAANVAAPRTAR